jgi:hypothetical protein
VVLPRPALDLGSGPLGPGGAPVHPLAAARGERDVVDPHRVAVVGHPVGVGEALAEAHRAAPPVPAQIQDSLAPLTLDLGAVDVPELPEQPGVEVEAPFERAHDDVEVVDRLHGSYCPVPGATDGAVVPWWDAAAVATSRG